MATCTASAFALTDLYACYTGVHAQAESCVPKLCARKMCVFVFICSAAVREEIICTILAIYG